MRRNLSTVSEPRDIKVDQACELKWLYNYRKLHNTS